MRILGVLFFLGVPCALLLGGVLTVFAGAAVERLGDRLRWAHGAAAALLAAGLTWVAATVTHVDEYRAPAEITIWDLMDSSGRWWVVIAVATGIAGLTMQIVVLARRGRSRRLRAWAVPVTAAGMFLLSSLVALVMVVGSH